MNERFRVVEGGPLPAAHPEDGLWLHVVDMTTGHQVAAVSPRYEDLALDFADRLNIRTMVEKGPS